MASSKDKLGTGLAQSDKPAAIRPIETRYKGYRFRSRLEARWAVAFDAMGWSWTYESEGYWVNGKRYLPDFLLRVPGGKEALVEIKPEADFDYPATVYMAGKMGEPGVNWRDWRPACLENYSIWDEEKSPRQFVSVEEGCFIYSGPYGDAMGNHSFMHGLDGVAWGYESSVVKRSFDGIRQADVVLALIDSEDCFGTLVEIGHASALRIPVHIATVRRDPDSDPFRELWFALKCAKSVEKFCTHTDARRWLLEQAGVRLRPEIWTLTCLAMDLKKDWVILYGSPGSADWHGSTNIKLSHAAIQAALGARFEHGERP
jgi:nucleoside 2-deoxyribosyltransferase